MKKIIKSRLFLVIITMILCISGTLYAANKYQASEVVYNKEDGTSMTVSEALDNIYEITKLGDATSEDIANGKVAVVQGKVVTGSAVLSDEASGFSKDISMTIKSGDTNVFFTAPYSGRVVISGTTTCISAKVYSITLSLGGYSSEITQYTNVASLPVSSTISVLKGDQVKILLTCQNNYGSGTISGKYVYK